MRFEKSVPLPETSRLAPVRYVFPDRIRLSLFLANIACHSQHLHDKQIVIIYKLCVQPTLFVKRFA